MKILFAAGGTGGHINPALAVAGEIRDTQPDADILFVGTKDKMESRLVPAAGFNFTTITISGFQRKISLENIKRNLQTLINLVISFFQVKKLLRDFAPDVVVGFGGYVSGPVLRAAAKKGIKTVIHEQNAFPGMANKALAKTAERTLLTVPEAAKLMTSKNEPIITGLPVRGEILSADKKLAREKLGIPTDAFLVFSTGGSLGARAINDVMLGVIPKLTDKAWFIHGYGKFGGYVLDKFKENGIDVKAPNTDIREYIYDMADCLAAADLIVSRAGASSLAEIQALGKAAVLIPSPNVAENHQYHNAMAMVNRDAALIIEEKNLTPEKLQSEIEELMSDRERLDKIGKNARAMAKTDAKSQIAKIVVQLAKE